MLNFVTLAVNGGLQPCEVNIAAGMLPEKFRYTEVKPLTDDIRKALENGEKVEGCRLLPRSHHIRIS